MSKWADYAIVGVKYDDDDHSRIVIVKRRPDLGSKLGKETTKGRTEIVDYIKAGHTHITSYWKNDQWVKGEDVRVVNLGGIDFIRTDRNKTKADNLGELPEF